jgi:hypothetical protein
MLSMPSRARLGLILYLTSKLDLGKHLKSISHTTDCGIQIDAQTTRNARLTLLQLSPGEGQVRSGKLAP